MKKLAYLTLLTCVFCVVFPSLAPAADFPNKALTIVCPYSPGGGSDIMVRTMAQIIKDRKLSPEPVMVVNKSGGGGVVGKTSVWTMPADGYTITLADMGNVVFPIVAQSTKWKMEDWTYMANLVFDYNLLCVKKGTYQNLDELIQKAKEASTPLVSGGTGATGGPDSICTIKLNKASGTKINYTPMKGGGEVVTALLGGHITMGWFNPSEIITQIEAGNVVALAVSAPERISSMPQTPTFKELGYDLIYVQQRGLAIKKGAPPETVQFWVKLLDEVRRTDEWKNGYLKKNILEDGWLPNEEFDQWMEEAKKDFLEIVKALKSAKN